MNDRRLQRVLAETIELLDRVATVLPDRLKLIAEAATALPSQASAGTGRGSGVSDPTYDAAFGTSNKPARDREELERELLRVKRSAGHIEDILASYEPRRATAAERRLTLVSGERPGTCWSCARIGKWEAVHRATEINGTKRDLDRWCYDWLRDTDRLPTKIELKDHHDGRIVRRPVKGKQKQPVVEKAGVEARIQHRRDRHPEFKPGRAS